MTWWAWMIGGALLLGAELMLVDAQFYLVFIGSAALVAGLAVGAVPSMPVWQQWALFGVLAIASMVSFRSRIYGLVRGRSPSVPTGPAGGVFAVPVTLEPGASCQAEHGGTFWTVRNESGERIPAGANARVVSVHGLTLVVRPDPKST